VVIIEKTESFRSIRPDLKSQKKIIKQTQSKRKKEGKDKQKNMKQTLKYTPTVFHKGLIAIK
jgi:hypothetical protein